MTISIARMETDSCNMDKLQKQDIIRSLNSHSGEIFHINATHTKRTAPGKIFKLISHKIQKIPKVSPMTSYYNNNNNDNNNDNDNDNNTEQQQQQ